MHDLLNLPTELRLLIWSHLYDILVGERQGRGHCLGGLDIQWDVYDTVHDLHALQRLFCAASTQYLTQPLAACEHIHNEALPYAVSAMERLCCRPRAVINIHALDGPGTALSSPEALVRPLRSLRLSECWQLRVNVYPTNEGANEQLIQRIILFSRAVFFPHPPKTVELCLQPPHNALSPAATEKLLGALCALRSASFHIHLGDIPATEISDEVLETCLLEPTTA